MLRTLLLAFAALLLGACSQEVVLAQYEPLPETLLAKESIDLLRAKNFDALLPKLAPETRNNPETAKGLPAAAAYFPDAEPITAKLVAYSFTTFVPVTGQPGFTNYIISFEYEFPQVWVLATATLRSSNSETSVLGIRLFQNQTSLEALNALTFKGKGAAHVIFVILASAILVLVLVSLIACIRTRVPRRKWLWIIFIMLGIGQIGLNWTTGEVFFAPAINLFGAAITRQPPGPWILQIALPLGAILFWWRKRAWVERSPADQFA